MSIVIVINVDWMCKLNWFKESSFEYCSISLEFHYHFLVTIVYNLYLIFECFISPS